jgi:hypothetical protein
MLRRLVPLTVAAVAFLPAAAHAASTVRVSAAPPAATKQGQAVSVTVTVANSSKKAVKGLTLAVAAPTGVAATPATKALPQIKGHGKATVTVSLTPSAAGDSTTTLSVRQGKKVRATSTVKVSAAPINPLIGRYFYNTYLVGAGMYYNVYYFASDGFAYRGSPDGGLPTCTAVTAVGDKDGCIPYTYDPATGTVSVDGETGRLTGDHILQLDGAGFAEAVTPAAGATYDVYVHSLNGSGICGVSCSFSSSELRLFPDGSFVRSNAASATTSLGSVTALPPNQHGTYAVADGGRITFTYADGRSTTQTIGVMVNDDTTVDPNYGLLLDGSIYWGPASDV